MRWGILITLLGLWLVAPAQTKVKTTKLGNSKRPLLFSFVHITDIHIGEGAKNHDFGSKGYFDQPSSNDTGYPTSRLRSSIQWIQANQQAANIQFVIATGDLTGSAETSEFMQVKEMMDSLPIPYVPLMGNHDAWPYNHFRDEAPYACGDSLMNVVFDATFKKLQSEFEWNDGSRTVRWINPEAGQPAYMQNYSFVYQGYRFVLLDFNPRYHVRKDEPGIGPEAQLTDYEGGTLPFLKEELRKAKEQNQQVVLFSHHPPMKNPLGHHYSFTWKERKILKRTMHPYRKQLVAWFAGHIHRWWHYHLPMAGLEVFETKANKAQPQGGFRVVQVYGR
ncbi:MAG: metallophosphoesterase [Chitinophagales bacterium]|nr:metallophosphoesterase [Chitinophagales bacterium]